MASPIAGWYPDPSGDASKLRYWDGDRWTENFMDRPPEAESAEPQSAEVIEAVEVEEASAPGAAQPQPTEAPSSVPGIETATVGTQTFKPQPEFQQQGPSGAYAGPNYQSSTAPGQVYEVSSDDRTLRLIAFVFAIVSTVCSGIFVIPLAWMIPMTVRCWSIYKGKKPNTVAFGVCTLIFVSIVSGILLLVSKKDD